MVVKNNRGKNRVLNETNDRNKSQKHKKLRENAKLCQNKRVKLNDYHSFVPVFLSLRTINLPILIIPMAKKRCFPV